MKKYIKNNFCLTLCFALLGASVTLNAMQHDQHDQAAPQATITKEEQEQHNYALWDAVLHGSIINLEAALNAGANIEATAAMCGPQGEKEVMRFTQWLGKQATVLSYAAGRDFHEVADQLIRSGANMNTPDDDEYRRTPLMIAVGHGSDAVTKILLKYGAYTNARTSSNETAAHFAAHHLFSHSLVTFCRYALSFDVDAQDNDGNTPLMILGYKDAVVDYEPLMQVSCKDIAAEALLRHGADFKYLRNNEGKTAEECTKHPAMTALFKRVRDGEFSPQEYKDELFEQRRLIREIRGMRQFPHSMGEKNIVRALMNRELGLKGKF